MSWLSRKIEELRNQSDHHKARTASVFTAVAGIVILILWGAILLPWQLAWNRPANSGGQVSGARNALPTFQPLP